MNRKRQLIERRGAKPYMPESAVKSIDEMLAESREEIRKDPEGFKEFLRTRDEGMGERGGLIANQPDKPCRMMREQLHLKNNMAGDLPAYAPNGKCYFDHQKNCDSYCPYWEGSEGIK